MTEPVEIRVNGEVVAVPAGTTVAAAVLIAGYTAFRHAVSGAPRGPLCGMGICFECRLTIDGSPQDRTCQIPCRAGMVVATDGG